MVAVTVRVTVCGLDSVPIAIEARLRSLGSIAVTPKSASPVPCTYAAQSDGPFRYRRPGFRNFGGFTCPAPCENGSVKVAPFASLVSYAVVIIADLISDGVAVGCTPR